MFELIIYDKIYASVSAYITTEQHGFLEGRSVCTNLVHFTRDAINWIEEGFQVDVFYADFQKAFDQVNHLILGKKLKKFGFHGKLWMWIMSYLMGRFQFVRFLGHDSQPYRVLSGVPQGSHLGPLLFLIFINDINCVFDINFLLYADDLKIYLKVDNLHDCYQLQTNIDNLVLWCNNNRLFLHLNKCYLVTYSRKLSPIVHEYFANNKKIDRCSFFKDLGVTFDNKITFSLHIDNIIAKSMSMLGFVKRMCRDFEDPYTLKALFCSFVRSHLEYASVVWCPNYGIHIKRIESVQRNFVRFALRKLPWVDNNALPSYENRCELIKLDTLQNRRIVLNFIFIRDLLVNKIDSPYLLSLINFNTGFVNTRNRLLFRLNRHRTNYGNNEPMTNMLKTVNFYSNDMEVTDNREIIRIKLLKKLKE